MIQIKFYIVLEEKAYTENITVPYLKTYKA